MKPPVMQDAPVAVAGAALTSGAIVFTQDNGWLNRLFTKKTAEPAASDITITGRRTSSSGNEKKESSSTLGKVLNTLLYVPTWRYEWGGTLRTDDAQIPLVLHTTVRGEGSAAKEYELTRAYTRSHEKPEGFTASLKKLVGVDIDAQLRMERRINNDGAQVPFAVARFTAKSGSEYAVYATRTFAANDSVHKQTMRELLFASPQLYQITDSAAETVFADCTRSGFTLYAAAADCKDDVKACIGLFAAYLHSLDEHERATEPLK